MLPEIIKGFLVGVCAAAPIGPVAIFVLQNTLSDGRLKGFFTGLGSTLVDTFYAAVAILALAIAEEFIGGHKSLILIAGGTIVICVGVSLTLRDPFRKLDPEEAKKKSPVIKSPLQCALLSLSNPGAIFVMFALCAFFGIKAGDNNFSVAPVILAVSAGSAAYWFFFSWVFSRLRRRIKLGCILWINRLSGIVIAIIGISLLAEGVMKLILT